MGGQLTDVLVDSGASVNCIDEDLVARAGGRISEKAPGRLLFPDQREAQVQGLATIGVKGRGYQEEVAFWVVRGLGIPVLFGEPWLRKWNPAIDWETREMQFSDGVVWRAQKPRGSQGEGGDLGHQGKGRAWAPSHRQTAMIMKNGGATPKPGERLRGIGGAKGGFRGAYRGTGRKRDATSHHTKGRCETLLESPLPDVGGTADGHGGGVGEV